MRVSVGAICCAVLVSSICSASADESGYYISAHGGWSFPQQTTSEFDSPGLTPGGVGYIVSDPDNGYRVGGSVGYIFNRYFRGEAELSYSESDINTLNAFSVGPVRPGPGFWSGPIQAKGDTSSLSGMVNGLITLPIDTVWTPYVGGGIGYTHVSANDVGFAGIPGGTDDSDGAFSWQLIAGLSFDISPNLELGGRYRYLHIGETTLYNSAGDQQRIDAAEAHSAEITLTWKLDRPQRAVPLK